VARLSIYVKESMRITIMTSSRITWNSFSINKLNLSVMDSMDIIVNSEKRYMLYQIETFSKKFIENLNLLIANSMARLKACTVRSIMFA